MWIEKDIIYDDSCMLRFWCTGWPKKMACVCNPSKFLRFRVNFYDFNSTLTLFYDHPFPFTELEFGYSKMQYFFMVALLILGSRFGLCLVSCRFSMTPLKSPFKLIYRFPKPGFGEFHG